MHRTMTMTILHLLLLCCCAWHGRAFFVPSNNKNNNNVYGLSSTKSHLSSTRQQHRSLLFQQRRHFQDFWPNGSNSTTYSSPGQGQVWSSSTTTMTTSTDGRFLKRDVSQVAGDRSYISPEFYSAASMRNPPVHPTEDWLSRDPRHHERGTWKKPDFAHTSFDDNDDINSNSNSRNRTIMTNNATEAWLNASLNHPVHFADDWWTDHPRALKLELSRVTEDPKDDEPPFFYGGGTNSPYFYGDERRAQSPPLPPPPPPYYFFEDPAAYQQNSPYDYYYNYYGGRNPGRMYYHGNDRSASNNRVAPTDQWWNKNNPSGQQQYQGMSRPRPGSQDIISRSAGNRSFGAFKKSSSPTPLFFQNFRQRVTSPQQKQQQQQYSTNGLEAPSFDTNHARVNDRPPLSANGVGGSSNNNNNNNNGERSTTTTKRYEPVLLSEKLKQGMARRGARDSAFDQGFSRGVAAGNTRSERTSSTLPLGASRDGSMSVPLRNPPVLLKDKLKQGMARGEYYTDRGLGSGGGVGDSSYYSNGNRRMPVPYVDPQRNVRGFSPYYDNGASNGRGISSGYQPMGREVGWSVRGSSGLMNQGMYYGTGDRAYGSTYSYGSGSGLSPYYNQERSLSPLNNFNNGWGNERMSSRYRPERLDEAWSVGNQRTQSNGLKQDMSRMSSDRAYESSYFNTGGSGNHRTLSPYYNGGRNNFYGNGIGQSSSYYYQQDGIHRSSSPYMYGNGNGGSFSPYYYQGGNERIHYSPFNPRGDLMTSSTSYYAGGAGELSSYSPFNQRGNLMSSSSSSYQGDRYGGSYSNSFNRRNNLMSTSNSPFPWASSWGLSSSFNQRSNLMSSSNTPFSGASTRGLSPYFYQNRSSSSRYRPMQRDDGWSVRKPSSLKRDISHVSSNLGSSLDDRPFSFRQ